MTGLDGAQLAELAGGPVTAENAADAEPVTDQDVREADKLASEAEQLATEAERAAVAGNLPPAKATEARESARFARLRADLTERRAERYKAAQRLQALTRVGEDALALSERLTALRDSVEADLAEADRLLAGARQRCEAWNAELRAIAERGAALNPDPVPPTGIPADSSGGVWAGEVDRGPRVIVRRRVISYIDTTDRRGDGLPVLIGAAVTGTSGADSSTRLVLLENGLVQTIGTDPHGIFQRKINAGLIHELTPRERRDYLAGRPVSWETISHD